MTDWGTRAENLTAAPPVSDNATGRHPVLFSRYVHTLWHLRPEQLVWRPYLRVRRAIFAGIPFLRRLSASRALAAARQSGFRQPGPLRNVDPSTVDLTSHLQTARLAQQLEFCFLNEPIRFRARVDWRCPDRSQLWRYNLHYQSYLVSLGFAHLAAAGPAPWTTFRALVTDWIACSPLPFGDAWHPYVVSLRVSNWITASYLFRDDILKDTDFQLEFLASLMQQLAFVRANLEKDVGGNHLLENVKALCLGGTALVGRQPEAWLADGLRLLQREIEYQVLPDGGHIERSPMYHGIVLEDLLIVAAALRNADVRAPAKLRECLGKMVDYYSAMLHPDGDIALFGDSAFGIGPEPGTLLAFAQAVLSAPLAGAGELGPAHALFGGSPHPLPDREGGDAGRQTLTAFPDTGSIVVGSGDTRLFFDAGPVCPDDLPAHAHADLLTYELSVRGRRWIVDTGVKEYVAGPWRSYSRSTRAHNTVCLAGRNQVDVWASFRVGRRARPFGVSWSHRDGISVLKASHAGYGSDRVHARVVVDVDSRLWFVIDEVGGRGAGPVESLVHLHPAVVVNASQGALHLARTDGDDSLWLVPAFAGAGVVAIEDAWYLPEFGRAVANHVVVLSVQGLPALLAYTISAGVRPRSLRWEMEGNRRRVILELEKERIVVTWDRQRDDPVVSRERP